MSLLLAVDTAIEARKLMFRLNEWIERAPKDKEDWNQLLDAGHQVYDRMEKVVEYLEHAVIPEYGAVSITFHPFRAEDSSALEREELARKFRVPRRAGDLRGTMTLPSSDPRENKNDPLG